jgi:hypothetical protein
MDAEGRPDISELRFVSIESMAVRAVCGRCNNGWMAELEREAAFVFGSWLRTGWVPVGGAEVVQRWLAARLVVWTARDGAMTRFMRALESDLGPPVCLVNHNRARALASGGPAALVGLACGFAPARGSFTFAFGNASTRPGNRAMPFTGVLALRLEPLELWVADCLLRVKRIALPRGVTPIADRRRLGACHGSRRLDAQSVVVHLDERALMQVR